MTHLITLDLETYYDQTYSLTKISTEAYVRDAGFETIGFAYKIDNGPTTWVSGDNAHIQFVLDALPWEDSLVLAHNTMFDGAILSWRYGVKPKGWLDTMSMGRALHGVDASVSLKAMAERYAVGVKGTEVDDAKGMRRVDFSTDSLARYAEYCRNDVELTYAIFQKMMVAGFPKSELKLIDLTLSMFIHPVLRLDTEALTLHLISTVAQKKEHLVSALGAIGEEELVVKLLVGDAETQVAVRKTLMSNPKFALMLKSLGVEAPTKISPTTGKPTLAFSKTDEAFKELLEHDDVRVQALCAARIGTKSTLEETRTQRFIDISNRGLFPVPLKYYAAHTGRWGGTDSVNLQNLPSRGANAGRLKKAILAPEGYVFVDADSSQIEARALAWEAGQEDLVSAFANGQDVYKIMASAIYNKHSDEITKDERFVGKTTILGCISEGTLVLSDSGWKPIEEVSLQNKLWDGENWVCHQGLVRKGYKETLNVCGVWLTPDHKILCGAQWKEAQLVAQDKNILCRALDIAVENLPLRAMSKGYGVGWVPLLLSVVVDNSNTQWIEVTLKTLRVLGAIYALKNQVTRLGNYIGATATYSKITNTVNAYSTVYLAAYHAAIQSLIRCTHITVAGGLQFTNRGVKTEKNSYATLFPSVGGITQNETLTASTTTVDTSQIIYGLQPSPKTQEINEKLVSCKRNLMTYDIAYAGPRNRFLISTNKGPLLVHNCGYGMGAVKFKAQLKTFAAEIEADEAKRVIDTYRSTYPMIPALWRESQEALRCMVRGMTMKLGRDGLLTVDGKGILLPNGLHIYYNNLQEVVENDKRQFTYTTRKGDIKIYGGKMVENFTQGIARCIIGEQMLKIAKRYKVVLTVHDSIGIVVKQEEADEARAYVESCMRWVPSWADGLPANCESGTGASYGDC